MEMKYIKYTETIPEHTIEKIKTIYVAFDGAEFDSAYDCNQHEKILLIKEGVKDIPHKTVERYDDENSYEDWYFVRNDKDIDILTKTYKLNKSDFTVGCWNGVQFVNEYDGPEFYLTTTIQEEIGCRKKVLNVLYEILEGAIE